VNNAFKLVAAVIVVASSTAAAADPAQAPLDRSRRVPPSAARPFVAPSVRESQLVNGVKLAVAEIKRLPIVSVDIILPYAGAAHDPQGKAGLAGLVSDLVMEGAGGMNGQQLAEALADKGISLGVSVDDDLMKISIFATKETLDDAMGLAAEIVRSPALPQPAFDRLKQETLAGVEQKRGNPGALAGERLAGRIYGSHPYGAVPSESSVQSLELGDARAFAASNLRPEGAVIAAAGDVSLTDFEALAAKHFGDWRAQAGAPVPAATPAVAAQAAAPGLLIDVIDMPGSQQSAIRAGGQSIKRTDPDYYSVALMNFLLGRAPILNRLERNLREQHRWAYGARLTPEYKLQGGGYVISADVQTDATVPALQEILKELRRLQTERVGDDELASTKRLMNGMFAMGIQTVQAVAGSVAANEAKGLPADELARYQAGISAVTADQLQAAANKYIKPDQLQVVISGDAARIAAGLAAVGQVRVYDVEGKLEQAGAKGAGR